jgi:hypothetical protein
VTGIKRSRAASRSSISLIIGNVPGLQVAHFLRVIMTQSGFLRIVAKTRLRHVACDIRFELYLS